VGKVEPHVPAKRRDLALRSFADYFEQLSDRRREHAVLRHIKLVTWNIHSGVGVDGRYDLARIAAALADEDADVIALQELDRLTERSAFHDQAIELAARLAMTSSFCATRTHGDGSFGLATLSRFRLLSEQQYDLSYRPNREPRSCLRVDLEVEPGLCLHVFNCHLGLATGERRFQRQKLLSDAMLLNEDLAHPVVVMGDFNDRPVSVVHRELRRHFADAFRTAGRGEGTTFQYGPMRLRLDHIYVGRGVRVVECAVRRRGNARIASDHRPLVARIVISPDGLPGAP
jgi:endonuclease/exonuclease/phosphatase family metal-dependent hydrolase